MPGRIPQSFIDDLLNRVDIVEVIDTRVPLKKAGREYQACCPFHNEKTPSFTVSPGKQFYHCFGCGAHGSAVGFLMEYDHLEFPEAIEELARSIGVEVPREDGHAPRQDPRRDDHYSLLERVDHFYRSQLREHSQAERAIDYLKERGLSGEIAATFGLGYAPPGWDSLLKFLDKDSHSQQLAVELGLLVKRDEGGLYDRFRDRIMFPIRDRRGRTIGFGGRVMGDEKPKYMNSPESPVFHKGQELYGLFEARKASQKLERLLVVEGYMDVVALAQFGLTNAVATLGTATTPDHLERLYRTVREVVFCFDGDAAGSRAAWRALENALPVMRDGREARFLFLPEGEDPDSLVRDIGKQAFQKKTVESVPLSQFFFEHLQQQVDMGSVDGRARLVELARPLLQTMPDTVFRDLMLNQLADRSGMNAARLQDRVFGSEITQQEEPPKPHIGHTGRSPVRTAIHLLLERPQLAETVEIPCGFEDLDVPGIALLSRLLEILHTSPNLSAGGILEHWRGLPEEKHLATLAGTALDLPPEGLGEEFRDAIQRLIEQRNRYRIELLLFQSRRQALSDNEKDELKALLASSQAANR
ncbi:DNA primase [Thiogranum longum]|uniref:DNA primase n=1 Tax=Thiogranum longum TaxID=1537524 RepID=A0A4R1HC20_9GAMM|nr:DNA primase [Thiogranum longum]TCK19547.1 DNA primase [Thiogranum longum]